jgi:hypothetical protein
MNDKFVLKNIGKGFVSFKVELPIYVDSNVPRHKLRKAIRNTYRDVVISPNATIDLVAALGFSSDVVSKLPEVVNICKNPNVKILSDLVKGSEEKAIAEAARAKAAAEAESARLKAIFEAQQAAQQAELDAEVARTQAETEVTPDTEEDTADSSGKKRHGKKYK